jgi:DNA polymerase III delta subunit
MGMKLIIINYETESYAKQRAADILDEWGFSKGNVIVTDNINNRARPSLFGEKLATELWMADKDALQKTLEILEPDANNVVGNGLVILFSLAENLKVVKAVKTLAKKLDCVYEHPKSDANGEISSIMNNVHLNQDAEQFLLDYVGKDYTVLLPIVKNISSLSRKEQQGLTINDLIIRMPQDPGEFPIWGDWKKQDPGLDGYIMQHQCGPALVRLERILEGGTSPLVIIAVLRNKFYSMFRLKSLLLSGSTPSEAAIALGLPDPAYYGKGKKDPRTGKSGYPTKKAIDDVGRYSMTQLSSIVQSISDTESVIKGQHPKAKMRPEDALFALVPRIV